VSALRGPIPDDRALWTPTPTVTFQGTINGTKRFLLANRYRRSIIIGPVLNAFAWVAPVPNNPNQQGIQLTTSMSPVIFTWEDFGWALTLEWWAGCGATASNFSWVEIVAPAPARVRPESIPGSPGYEHWQREQFES